MKIFSYQFAVLACCAQIAGPALAAPLDAFLSANKNTKPWQGEIEAGYDVANKTVDIFKIREQDASTGSSTVGDYHGAHLRGGVAVMPQLWLDGSLWQRQITSRNFEAKVTTWQVAAQYKVLKGAGLVPNLALRASAWGDYASELKREKNITVSGTVLKSARVTDPSDRQLQLDAVASWPLSQRTELSAFAGAGASRVDFDQAGATTTIGGCLYNLNFGPSALTGTCSTNPDNHFKIPNSGFNFDVNKEVKYSAKYVQAGLSSTWHNEKWQLRAGYQFQHIVRDHVDDAVTSRGGTAYENNHILVADVAYKVHKKAALFLRGQYMANQFNGEMPMAYNSLTASTFNQHYGMVSTGLLVSF